MKKKQHIPHKLTEAQEVAEQNAEGWKQTPWPSKLLVIIALVCFLAFSITALAWASSVGEFIDTGYYRTQADSLRELYWERLYTTDDMMQLMMLELDWPVDLEENQWWFDCRERLGLEWRKYY